MCFVFGHWSKKEFREALNVPRGHRMSALDHRMSALGMSALDHVPCQLAALSSVEQRGGTVIRE